MTAATRLGKFSGSVLVAQKGKMLLSKGYEVVGETGRGESEHPESSCGERTGAVPEM